MPPRQKNQNASGLGRAIINKKVKDAREQQESGLYTTDLDPTSRLKSVTQEKDLDEFLNTAQLAGTEFTAERRNVKIIQSAAATAHNPYLLSEQEEQSVLRKHRENKQRLRVPRRPPWTKKMTAAQLDRQEKDAFLEWRRGLAHLQDEDQFLLTPFERNIEVWRQLWRVLERSQLVVQIVDARNPLRFRCEDLETYVKDIEGPEGEEGTGAGAGAGKRRSLLLLNKADLLTVDQRRGWADFFDQQGVQYAFFSAANAAALQRARQEALLREEEERVQVESNADEGSDSGDADVSDESDSESANRKGPNNDYPESDDESSDDDHFYLSLKDDNTVDQDPRTRVLSVLELEDLFTSSAPPLTDFLDPSDERASKLTIGLVGYPNVGKSSTINALLGEKKVSVSSTPGKTKHFQTIHLSPTMVLCDCPGLVFPQFATTKAALVCDGVLPIDQMREYSGPISLVVKRLPQEILEATYGLSIRTRGFEEGGDGEVKAEDFMIAYAISRGFMRSGQGNPDEARAARYILKDYVNGKLLFCHPPPDQDDNVFNAKTHEQSLQRAQGKKRAPVTRVGKNADTYVAPTISAVLPAQGHGQKSQVIDHDFFAPDAPLSSRPFVQGTARHGSQFSRTTAYPHQNIVGNDGKSLNARQSKANALLGSAATGKKHHKKATRVKQRSGKGYD